jgi:hypothetical protein
MGGRKNEGATRSTALLNLRHYCRATSQSDFSRYVYSYSFTPLPKTKNWSTVMEHGYLF